MSSQENRKTNKLNIYLLKKNIESFLKSNESNNELDSKFIKEIKLSKSSNFFYQASHSNKPGWIKSFFKNNLAKDLKIFGSSSKAVFIKEIDVNGGIEKFAICFGQGRHLINSEVVEDNFGLKTALNLIKPESIRSVDKKNLSTIPKYMKEQMSKLSDISDFGFNIDQDLIEEITGTPSIEKFGKSITGKDALSVSVKIDIDDIGDFLKDIFLHYKKDNYKEKFSWVDCIQAIKRKYKINDLDDKLLNKIKNLKEEKVWMAIPEILEWSDVAGFCYTQQDKKNLKPDLSLDDFLSTLTTEEKKTLSIEKLKKKRVLCFSSSKDEIQNEWPLYKCMYAEVVLGNDTYILSDGSWYQIETGFSKKVNQEFSDTYSAEEILPRYAHVNEARYNEDVANKAPEKYFCMDRKNIPYGGGRSKIEFCDLFSKNKKEMIHVKHYGSSSVLSHLFNQGLVSSELFLSDKEFRKKVNDKLRKSHKLDDYGSRPNPREYKVIFAVISRYREPLNLPFFSKVSIKSVKTRLQAFGFQVSLVKIGPSGESVGSK